jgi:hypothetical protein
MGNPLLGFLNQMPQTNGANGMSMLMNAMRSGGNPLNFLGSLAGIDVSKVKSGDLPNLCRTLCQKRGLNYDEVYQQAQQIFNQLNR